MDHGENCRRARIVITREDCSSVSHDAKEHQPIQLTQSNGGNFSMASWERRMLAGM